ncbi:hypothetical protein AB6A23_01320 [Paenibacillus tarimensis]
MENIGKRSERRKKSRYGRLGKWVIILLFIGAVGFTGYKVALTYVSDKLMERFTEQFMDDRHIEQLANDPNIRKIIEDNADRFDKETIASLGISIPAMSGENGNSAAEDDTVQSEGQETATTTDSPKLVVTTREEATKLLLDKFTVKELSDLAGMAASGLDSAKLEQIQSKLLSELTEEEFESIRIVALMEVMKYKN